ncbi:D-2-hydroxyacid dehydrogenase family protein [Gluconacetobacter tumulicola]|uniref:D-2-hydroxyacid dehydrogenase family protein n=1 Tax=Gluconacetobacter tumulicola TaxID=1017177 RepID=A0A7W4P574_9PROT|nr:D-2-hydroxyacid dehydrogenase family protein [Gluconacetobacter tumulicola]MBB2177732.1 D-2-hydroxyacid dehydrogenase family protein [Gluconacetobacter tumulicola]
MMKCIILDDYQNVALRSADWASLHDRVDVQVLTTHIDDEAALVAALASADIVVVMRERTPFPAGLFAALPCLRLLVTSGMRNASIDLEAARAHGVTVCGTASSLMPPVEMTWALILGLARHIVPENRAMQQGGPWQRSLGRDLAGHRLGLLGVGRIGGAVARVGQAFGMRVSGWSPHFTPERAASAGVEFVASKELLLAESDIVSIHLVLGDATRRLVGASDLALMKRDALLINTSRAAIVDEAALIEVLESGRIGGAGLDVFEHEPLPPQHPYRTLSNVLATPHLGYVTRDNYDTYFRQAVEDIHAWLDGCSVRIL